MVVSQKSWVSGVVLRDLEFLYGLRKEEEEEEEEVTGTRYREDVWERYSRCFLLHALRW